MINRNVINNLMCRPYQIKLAEKFSEGLVLCARIKNARIMVKRIDGLNMFCFERGAGLRRQIMTVPLSDDAVDALVALRDRVKMEAK